MYLKGKSMHIIFDEDAKHELSKKHIILELDTVRVHQRDITAYCVLDQIPFTELSRTQEMCDLHSDMMAKYKTRQWVQVQDMANALMGQWGGKMDSFYQEMLQRMSKFLAHEPDADWQPVLDKN